MSKKGAGKDKKNESSQGYITFDSDLTLLFNNKRDKS